MNACALRSLRKWEEFDSFAQSLEKLGWNPTQKADGPDARSWAFDRDGIVIWLVFDDLLGGSLKSEDSAVNLGVLSAQLEASSGP